MAAESYAPFVMIRRDLQDLPIRALPASYSLSWYTEGDEMYWIEIQSQADRLNRISRPLFKSQFASKPDELPRRQAFILDESGRPVGTATAWFGELRGVGMGRIH